jgi:hypothetical protein
LDGRARQAQRTGAVSADVLAEVRAKVKPLLGL